MDAAHSSVAVSSQAVREATLLLPTLQAQKTLALFTASTLISPEQVCVSASVRVSKRGFIWLYSHHSDGCCAFVCVRESAMNVCLCHFFTFAWLWLFMYRLNSLFILHLEPCVCMSVCIWNCFSVWLWRINCGKMLGGCLCSYHNGRGSWGRKKKEWEREKDWTTPHLSKIHPSCLLFSS